MADQAALCRTLAFLVGGFPWREETVCSLKAKNKALDLDRFKSGIGPVNLFGTSVSSFVNQDDNNENA